MEDYMTLDDLVNKLLVLAEHSHAMVLGYVTEESPSDDYDFEIVNIRYDKVADIIYLELME
jgi:hypothetical protein